ncbi:hypothetical protein GLOTRDRAFT_80193 [Gloeophyllum trabeum ATCC 11539]|uniref:Wax synthase domain-containing protein n=1 Tax=Gloeophyllum trabeum (strain ATCC 11539 / FP-39264 / Madison 617) TaxID=670483 RepID=S7PXL5_GLOTA|nr:uncharacterized protein GLOTRDRAFT_80193 [Gloeophyllum trabeum ATCC 11539]EPQ52037.1 hypothetical protein GLOTRDRAFT_80193 [Gloeophyllum trabeum ATCC 11539]
MDELLVHNGSSPSSFLTTDLPNVTGSFSILRNLLLPNICLSFVIALQLKPHVRLACFVAYSFTLVKGFTLSTGDSLRDYSMGSAISSDLATAIHMLWLTDPVSDFSLEKDSTHLASLPFLKRWYWTLCALYSPRGVGWNYQVANVPPASAQSRWRFVARQLLRAFTFYLLVDFAQTYIHSNPLFTNPRPGASPFDIHSQGYFCRCVNIIAWLTLAHGSLNMQYLALSAFCVSSGVSEPRYWPDLFGDWKECYTVRRHWGVTWHQLMRRYTSSIGRYSAQTLGCKRGTTSSSYIQLYVGFLVSGLVHIGGDAMVGKQYLGASFPFFLAQAVAITLEDAVIAFASRVGLKKRCPRFFGYVWVFVWFSICRAWYIQWAVDAGLAKTRPLKLSIVQTALYTFHNSE